MFAAHCTTHGTEVLLTERRITGITVGPDTVTVAFTCWCGTPGTFVDPRLPAGSAPDLPGASHHVLGRRQLA
jgi:hypothetical protein